MSDAIQLATQRLVIVKMLLNTFREAAGPLLGEDQHFGTKSDEILLCSAVLVGQIEGRPMGVSKLSSYAGIPRATVIRKLRSLEGDGLVVRSGCGTFTLSTERLNHPSIIAVIERISGFVRSAAAKLSILNTHFLALFAQYHDLVG